MKPADKLIAKHVKTINECYERINDLEIALEKYGNHLPTCHFIPEDTICFHTGIVLPANENCTCGLEEVFNG